MILLRDVFCELVARGLSPDVTKVPELIERCAKEWGTPDSVARVVAKDIGPYIQEHLKQIASMRLENAKETGQPARPASWVVEIYRDGDAACTFAETEDEAIAKLQEHTRNAAYDIIVNEVTGVETATFHGTHANAIRNIAPRMRGMIWLILTNASTTRTITYLQIAKTFHFSNTAPSAWDDKIHRYRKRLDHVIGRELCQRIFDVGVGKMYPLKRTGWSFLWLRRVSHESALIYGIWGDNPLDIT
jgi:hypothetical protein